MPLNESIGKAPRARWPLSFDLEGVPQDTKTRKQLLEQQNLQVIEEESMSPVTQSVRNSFTVDQPSVEITDINHPPHRNYNPHAPENQYPKMLYHHENGRVLKVGNEKEEKAASKRGFKLKPSPDFDYSQVSRAGVATKASNEPKREEEMSAEELAALDEGDES